MNGAELVALFKTAGKRHHIVGDAENGVIAGLDLEGRLFAVMNGRVLNRVNQAAVLGITTRAGYLNPGGDGLWPAPEGTSMGYQYSTGAWRVPPGLSGARFIVAEQGSRRARIEAEIDLVNASGLGIPTLFSRDITVSPAANSLAVSVKESIRYLGTRAFSADECRLAPWSLCQFDSGPGCEVVFPVGAGTEVWDLYDASTECRSTSGNLAHTKTDCSKRYQIGIGPGVPWIELRKPADNLAVRRSATAPRPGLEYIDIADAPPTVAPSRRRTRFSVYSDMNGFMEIEACGACPRQIEPGAIMDFTVTTEYRTSERG